MSKIDVPDLSQMSDEELDAALAEPDSSATDLQAVQNDINDYKKYGDSGARTFVESVASGLTLGLSDQAQVKLGISTPEELKKRAEFNPIPNIAGQVVGTVAPIVASGGTSLAAKGVAKAGSAVLAAEKAGILAQKATEKVLSNVLKQSSNKKLAKEILKKSAEKAAQGATEGAIYGAGQLVREDALGEADFNAENLLAYSGSGALLGGALGSVLPGVGYASSKAAKMASEGAEKIYKKYADPVEDSARLLGFTRAQIEKINAKNPTFFEGVPTFIKDKLALKVGDDVEDLAAKNAAIKKAAVKEMDLIYDAVAEKSIDKKIISNIADTLEERFIKPYEGMDSFKSAISPARKIVKDIKSIVKREGTLNAKELRSLRQKMDELADSYYKARDPSKGAEAAFAARSLMKDELNAFVSQIDANLGKRLQDANKDFHYAQTIGKAIDKKALKSDNLLDFKDYALGGIFGGLLGSPGLLIPAAKKFLESDLKRKITILSGIQNSNKLVTDKIASSAKNFLKTSARAVKPLSVKALINSPLAYKDNKRPSDNQEAFTNIRDKVKELQANPEQFTSNIAKSLYSVSRAAPQTAAYMNDHAARALTFIEKKLPKDLTEMLGPKFMQEEFMPSTMEIAEFERYMQVIDNPLSVLEELEDGTLTQEHVEALKEVYPNLYARIRAGVMDEIRNEQKMAYDKKVQLGLLLDIETDQSMIPENLLALQANFSANPQTQGGAVNPTASGVQKLNMAEREKTNTQEVMERE